MAKILFVVHRYAPYPGGSEANTHRLAKQAVIEGHDVLVLSDAHMGDYEGVRVTSDRSVAHDRYDMIIVHGSCPTQDYIHANKWQSPVYYLLVEPPRNGVADTLGIANATWIGCGTTQDLQFVQQKNVSDKARKFIYSVPYEAEFPRTGQMRQLLNIQTPYVAMSSGGFWPHKRFQELVDAFNEVNNEEWSLVLFGYDTTHPFPINGNDRVFVIGGAEPDHIYASMADFDLYIMNSETEGYGLTLLEAMINKMPWIARDIAAAYDFARADNIPGRVYTEVGELKTYLKYPPSFSAEAIEYGYNYVKGWHTPHLSLASILSVL